MKTKIVHLVMALALVLALVPILALPAAAIGPIYTLTVSSYGCCAIAVEYTTSGGTQIDHVIAGGTEHYPGVLGGSTVYLDADDSGECCIFTAWSLYGDSQVPGPDPKHLEFIMDGDHVAVAESDTIHYGLTVTSDGCCPITVTPIAQDPYTVPAGGTDTRDVACGTLVTLEAVTTDCCLLDGWKVDGSPVGGNPILVWIDGDHTAVAECSVQGPFTLTITDAGCCSVEVDGQPVKLPFENGYDCGTEVTVSADDSGECCTFISWSDGGAQSHTVVMDSDVTLSATCETERYTLEITDAGCCSVEVDGQPVKLPYKNGYDCGTEVLVEAIAGECCEFISWSDGGGQSHYVVMDSDVTLSATCETERYTLEITDAGCCEVWVGVGADEPVELPYIQEYDCGTEVLVEARPGDCCEFISWSDGGGQSHYVVMDSDKTLSAICELAPVDLTVVSAGCCPIQVTYDGQEDTVEPCTSETFTVDCGTEVTVSADDSGECCTFVNWSDGGAQTHAITVTENQEVTAYCVLVEYTLTVTSDGCCEIGVGYDPSGPCVYLNNGPHTNATPTAVFVVVPPGGTMDFTVPCGREVSLNAVGSEECCTFVEWQVDEGSPTTDNPITVTMDGDHTAVATCEPEPPVVVCKGASPSMISLWWDGMTFNPEYYSEGPSLSTMLYIELDDDCCPVTSATVNLTDLLIDYEEEPGVLPVVDGLIPEEKLQKFIGQLDEGGLADWEGFLAGHRAVPMCLSCGGDLDCWKFDLDIKRLLCETGDFFAQHLGWSPEDYGQVITEIMGQELQLGEFEIELTLETKCAETLTEYITLTIVDYQLPIGEGWNLRSTWIALENNKWQDIIAMDDGLKADSLLRWNGEFQRWEYYYEEDGVGHWYYDGTQVVIALMQPLDSYWIHGMVNDQLGLISYRGISAPPSSDLYRGWNLISLSTDIYRWGAAMPVYQALISLLPAPGMPPIGSLMVLSPEQFTQWVEEFSVCCDGFVWSEYQKWFRQEGWSSTIGDMLCGGGPCEGGHLMSIGGGYWVFMEQDDLLGGFSYTPLPSSWWQAWAWGGV